MIKKAALTLCALTAAALPLTPVDAGETVGGPDFSAAFTPDTVGPGGTSMLVFTIDNSEGTEPVTDLAFTATLPSGQTIATPAQAQTDCGGASLVLTAPDGGTTISLADAAIGAGETCTVMVNVVGTSTDTMISGDLTSNEGNSGNAAATLTVDGDLPGISKSFAPSTVAIGERSTLTFTFDFGASEGSFPATVFFTDNLPAGMEVANPPNIVNTCTIPGTVSATPGSGTISVSGAAVSPTETCTISVDVVATGAGRLENVTEDIFTVILSTQFPAGKAGDVLDVTVPSDLLFTKEFIDDPASPGGTTILEFTIENLSRTDTATNIAFTDDLTTVLTGLTATLPPSPDPPCGAGSTLTAPGNVLTLSGGNLPPEGTCTFQVTLNVPAGAAAGSYLNTTDTLTAVVGGDGVTVAPATDTLFISEAPTITKSFLDNPVVTGGTTRLEFTITNTSTFPATDVAFSDDLTDFLGDLVLTVTGLPADDFCGTGSKVTFVQGFNPAPPNSGSPSRLDVTGIDLAAAGMPGDSCTFDVTVHIPLGLGFGTFTNTTSSITATVDGSTETGGSASADLEVVSGVNITKEFTDDPVVPGGTATLEFTLSLDEDAPTDATNIAFTDDLGGVLTGLVSTSGTQNNICGTGSELSGTSTLSFTGGTLSPGQSCTFSVQVAVPGGAASGPQTNTTSNVTATIDGLATQGLPASDDLVVSGLVVTKEFIDDPVIPGGTTTLRFTLDNTNGTVDATSIVFSDNLHAVLPNLGATLPPSPDPPCGAGSLLSGITAPGSSTANTLLTLINGSVLAGQICSFDVTLNVPAAAASGAYANATTIDGSGEIPGVAANFGAGFVTLPPARDDLVVAGELLLLTKEFTDDPVEPGGTATLEFTLTNLDPNNAATGIGFTDDLDAALSGLTLVGDKSNVCGLGSMITGAGTGTLTLTAGTLAAGDSCTFDVDVLVPGAAPTGEYPNTTSQVTGTISGLGVTGDPASDDLSVGAISFTKQFTGGPVLPGGTTTLEFTIQNNSASAISNIGFTDDLDTVLLGLTAIGPLPADPCGTGSTLLGTSVLSLSNGSLLPGGSCTFSVDVQVPLDPPAPGAYTNTTSPLIVDTLPTAPPAVADLIIDDVGNDIPNAYSAALDAAGKAWISEILSPLGDVDVYSFTVAQNSTVTIFSSGGLNTLGDLLDGAGGLLNDPGADSDAGADNNFQTTQVLGPGTYFVRVSGNSGADVGAYMFHVDVTALPPDQFQADALIGKKQNSLKGDNIYNKNAAGQKITVRGKAKKGRAHKYFFAVENDGDAADAIRVRPAKPNVNDRRWKVRIFQLTGGRTNVTGAFEGKRIDLTLNPAERVIYQVKASLKFNPTRKLQRTFGVRALSTLGPGKDDMVESTIKLRP